MNSKILFGSLTGAVLIHAVLSACSGTKGASAQSAPIPVQVSVVDCDQTMQIPGPPTPIALGGDGGPSVTTVYYAEAAFPGLSAQQLAGHVTNWNTPTPGDFTPSGYTLRGQDAIYTKDGFVGAGCSQGATSTFIYAP